MRFYFARSGEGLSVKGHMGRDLKAVREWSIRKSGRREFHVEARGGKVVMGKPA